MPTFEYTTAIVETFPSVIGGVLIGNVTNAPTPPPLATLYLAEQEAMKNRYGDDALSSIEALWAWRNAFKQFGVDPTKYRSAAEALLRRLTKKGDIPSINTLVDVGNLVSIRYALPIAIFDIRQLVGDNLSVRLAMGNETFLPIGSDGIEHPDTGEVIFADMDANVYARRWCWRQSLASAAQEDTTQVIVTVEAHHTGGLTDIESALADLMQLLTDYAGFSGRVGVVSATIGINLSKKSQGRRSRAALVLGGMGEQIIDQLSV